MKAVVVEIVSKFENTADTSWKYSKTLAMAIEDKSVPFAEIRIRIPELHAHIPEPKDPDDQAAINKHPIALLFQSTDGSIPEVGDIVDVDFADKNNFKDALITSVVTKGTQNSTPATQVACSISDTYNSAVPSLNTAQSSGDAQTSSSTSISGDPSLESSEVGVGFDNTVGENELLSNYFVSMSDFNTMTEFRNYSQTLNILKEKNIFNITIQVADDENILSDIERLMKVSEIASDSNIGVYLWISTSYINSETTSSHMLEILKKIKTKGVFFAATGDWTKQQSDDFSARICGTTKELGLKFGALMMNAESSFSFTEDLDIIYIMRNQIDNHNDERFDITVRAEYGLYHLGGYNFLPTEGDPCQTGSRTPERLERELNMSQASEKYGFLDYSLLTHDFTKVIENKFFDIDLQNLLSTLEETQEIPKANLEVSSTSLQQKEPPTFNSDSSGSQDVNMTAPPSNGYVAGLQCAPTTAGPSPSNYGGSGAPPPAPSFRFDSIANAAALLWTTSPSRIMTQPHIDFMNKLAQKVYQIIPLTDPIFASTDDKKLYVTSTTRTPTKQVELMWGKRQAKTAKYIKDMYSNSSWSNRVVDLYPYGNGVDKEPKARYLSAFSHANHPEAVQEVTNRVARGSSKGGHLYGNGIDIRTNSALLVEGLKSYSGERVSEATMGRSRFVQAVVQCCRELGAGYLIEDYQEHIHITFPR
tara:strand:- start:5171 stop:7282 length:2112 start_codon:yes stop_codon:yes gene_type:complete